MVDGGHDADEAGSEHDDETWHGHRHNPRPLKNYAGSWPATRALAAALTLLLRPKRFWVRNQGYDDQRCEDDRRASVRHVTSKAALVNNRAEGEFDLTDEFAAVSDVLDNVQSTVSDRVGGHKFEAWRAPCNKRHKLVSSRPFGLDGRVGSVILHRFPIFRGQIRASFVMIEQLPSGWQAESFSVGRGQGFGGSRDA